MSTPDRLAFGDFVLDRRQRRLLRGDGSTVTLTPRLYSALLLFVESDGRLLDKDTLMRSLWPRLVVEENNLSQVISGLRHALGDAAKDSRYLVTVPRVGFRFVATVHALADEAMPAIAGSPAAAAPSPAATAALRIDRAEPMPLPAAGRRPADALHSRRGVLASAAAAAGALAAAAWWVAPRRSPDPASTSPRGASGYTRNAEAFQLYEAAMWRMQSLRREDLDRGLQLLDRALALDPDFALAWVAVARIHRQGLLLDTRPAEVFGPAETALRRAAALAPGLTEVLVGRGLAHWLHGFDWPAAERCFRDALAGYPNAAGAHFALAQLQLAQGRIVEGAAHLRRSLELESRSPLFNTVAAGYLLDLGHRAEAQQRLDVVLAQAPEAWPVHMLLGKLRLAEGHADDGMAALRQAAELGRDSSRPLTVLGVHLAAVGQADEARRLLVALEDRSRTRYVPPTAIAALRAALGRTDPALDALELAVAVRDTRVVFLKDDPSWRMLRPEPRFAALIRQLGLDRFGPGLSQA
jgi:DNA-binding winged helix-turn-helix (wHTH) protein/tetratricopeptide (TPR) repeat protein